MKRAQIRLLAPSTATAAADLSRMLDRLSERNHELQERIRELSAENAVLRQTIADAATVVPARARPRR